MYRLFYKYRPVIVSGLILISLVVATFASNSIKDFFVGVATGAALLSFGQSLGEVQSKKQISGYDVPLDNK